MDKAHAVRGTMLASWRYRNAPTYASYSRQASELRKLPFLRLLRRPLPIWSLCFDYRWYFLNYRFLGCLEDRFRYEASTKDGILERPNCGLGRLRRVYVRGLLVVGISGGGIDSWGCAPYADVHAGIEKRGGLGCVDINIKLANSANYRLLGYLEDP